MWTTSVSLGPSKSAYYCLRNFVNYFGPHQDSPERICNGPHRKTNSSPFKADQKSLVRMHPKRSQQILDMSMFGT